MTQWTPRVQDPFREDPEFWASVGRSTDALLALLVATVLVVVVSPWAAIAFVVPAVLLVLSARDARSSSARTRQQFASRIEWRDAERQAVAAAIPGAFVRYFRAKTAARAAQP
jgi:hypothetical protein